MSERFCSLHDGAPFWLFFCFGDSQSTIIGCYVIVFGAGEYHRHYVVQLPLSPPLPHPNLALALWQFCPATLLLEFQIPPYISRWAPFLFNFLGRGICMCNTHPGQWRSFSRLRKQPLTLHYPSLYLRWHHPFAKSHSLESLWRHYRYCGCRLWRPWVHSFDWTARQYERSGRWVGCRADMNMIMHGGAIKQQVAWIGRLWRLLVPFLEVVGGWWWWWWRGRNADFTDQ